MGPFALRVAKEIGQTPVAVMMGREDMGSTGDSSHRINGLSFLITVMHEI